MKKRKSEVKFRHRVVIRVAKIILYPFIKLKYRYEYKVHKNLKKQGPFLILGNHTVGMDPILMSFSFPFHLYYLATEQIFNLGLLSKLLVYAVNPISKSKSLSDIAAIRKARKIVNEGGSIGLYPEGNLTYDGKSVTINESIVKLVRLLDIDIIFYITKGLYLSDPRWAVFKKKGKTSGYIKRIVRKEEYDNLTNDELYELIINELDVNAYEQQALKLEKYVGKNLAIGLERLIFMDLNKGIPFVTYTEGNSLKSHQSDFKLTIDKFGYVTDEKGIKKTLVELNDEVINSYHNYYKKVVDDLLIEEKGNVELTTNKVKSNKGINYIRLYKDKIIVEYDNAMEEFHFDEITSLSIQGKKKIIINDKNKTMLLTFNINSSPYKYLLTYQYYKEEKNDDTSSVQQFGL